MIWPFKKKKPSSYKKREQTLVDLHNHVLFGVDDGAPDIQTSVVMLEKYKTLGYQKVWATPHHNHYMFDTPQKEELLQRLSQLESAASKLGISLKLGAEVMLRDDYIAKFKTQDFPNINGTYLVELENRMGNINETFEKVIFDFQIKGKTLILAHPERHPSVQKNVHVLKPLKQRGMLVQINVRSLTGRYGVRIMDCVWRLLREGLVDIAATDLHNTQDFEEVDEALVELYEYNEAVFKKLTQMNPGYVFDGKVEMIDEY